MGGQNSTMIDLNSSDEEDEEDQEYIFQEESRVVRYITSFKDVIYYAEIKGLEGQIKKLQGDLKEERKKRLRLEKEMMETKEIDDRNRKRELNAHDRRRKERVGEKRRRIDDEEEKEHMEREIRSLRRKLDVVESQEKDGIKYDQQGIEKWGKYYKH